jgi:hypothetical protein
MSRRSACAHAMQRRAIAIVRPHLHDVSDVNHECVGYRLYPMPFPSVKDFESGLVVLQQQGQGARVRVTLDAELIWRRRFLHGVVVEPQKAGMSRLEVTGEVPLRHSEIHGHRPE